MEPTGEISQSNEQTTTMGSPPRDPGRAAG
jgi:hypothetical protein